MKVFVSSVRRGLEGERDALPGLIRAIGHEPLRFEDFTARSEPSREACLKGVESSDVVVLLAGPYYGHRLPDTNQSPTEDEWAEATRLGKRRLVFVKEGLEVEPEQKDFLQRIGDYREGVFYSRFSDTGDLLTKVAAAIIDLASHPTELEYRPLPGPPVAVGWLTADQTAADSDVTPYLELHVIPLPERELSSRELTKLGAGLPGLIRRLGVVPDTAQIDHVEGADSVVIRVPQAARPWNGVAIGSIGGLRLSKDGRVAVWATLPRDSMGAVLDAESLPTQIAGMLRLVGGANLVREGSVAIALGLPSTLMVSADAVARLPRSSASMGFNHPPVRIDPDEAVTSSALSTAADEAARPLAQALIAAFTRHTRWAAQ